MTLKNKFTKAILVPALSLAALNAYADEKNICDQIAECVEDKPKAPAKKTCAQEYEQGVCLPDDLARSVLGEYANVKDGLCPGGPEIRCYDAEDTVNIRESLNILFNEGTLLRNDHDAVKRTLDNHLRSTEQLHRVMGRALQPELKDLEQKQALYEMLCQPATTKENCLPAWVNYQNAVMNLAGKIRQNLLDTPEAERFRMSLLIDAKLHDYFKEDFDRTKQMINDKTVKLSFMGTVGYQFSALNTEADSDVSHAFVPGLEACLYTPSELFGFCLTGNLLVGNTADRGLGVEKIYNFSLPTVVNAQDHGEYSDVNTVETDVDIARITYGSVGATTKLGGLLNDNWKLSFLASLNLEIGREFTTTVTKGTSVLSFQGVPEDPRTVNDVTEEDSLFVEVVPQAGAEVCYDFGLSRSCAYGKLGPSFPTGDSKNITLNGGVGFGTGLHF